MIEKLRHGCTAEMIDRQYAKMFPDLPDAGRVKRIVHLQLKDREEKLLDDGQFTEAIRKMFCKMMALPDDGIRVDDDVVTAFVHLTENEMCDKIRHVVSKEELNRYYAMTFPSIDEMLAKQQEDALKNAIKVKRANDEAVIETEAKALKESKSIEEIEVFRIKRCTSCFADFDDACALNPDHITSPMCCGFVCLLPPSPNADVSKFPSSNRISSACPPQGGGAQGRRGIATHLCPHEQGRASAISEDKQGPRSRVSSVLQGRPYGRLEQ